MKLRYSARVFLSLMSTALMTMQSSAHAATHEPQNAPPHLMLANSWRPDLALADYWVSEKLDGVRGYWDGRNLWTRGGGLIVAPAWFTAGWPKEPLDGELWAGRGRFTTAQSTVATNVADDAAWHRMRFMVFDMPSHPGLFDRRKDALSKAVALASIDWLQVVSQVRLPGNAQLQAMLRETVDAGGEGLMLHRAASPYRADRSDDLVKVKLHDDADATVVGYVAGKGKHQGRMGALVVETPTGIRFSLGSGFTDNDRASPPAIGTSVTYRFRGVHPGGVPRFATFTRVRLL